MVERRPPLLDEPRGGSHEWRALETARVERPPGWFSSPYGFPWVSSLAIGWDEAAVRARLLPARPGREAPRATDKETED